MTLQAIIKDNPHSRVFVFIRMECDTEMHKLPPLASLLLPKLGCRPVSSNYLLPVSAFTVVSRLCSLSVHPPPLPHTPARQMPSVFHYELISSTYNPFNTCAIMERHNPIQPSVTLCWWSSGPPITTARHPTKSTTSSDPHNNLELSPPWVMAKPRVRGGKMCCKVSQLESGESPFKLWCWRRLWRGPWTAGRSNQSILGDINPEYSLKGLMLQLKLQYFGHLMWRAYSLERPWCWERLKSGGKEGNRGSNGWMASPTWWMWIWANSGRPWRTGRTGVLIVDNNWATEQEKHLCAKLIIPLLRQMGLLSRSCKCEHARSAGHVHPGSWGWGEHPFPQVLSWRGLTRKGSRGKVFVSVLLRQSASETDQALSSHLNNLGSKYRAVMDKM